jgi:hypothetical protein
MGKPIFKYNGANPSLIKGKDIFYMESIYYNSNNAVEAAFLQNPTNYSHPLGIGYNPFNSNDQGNQPVGTVNTFTNVNTNQPFIPGFINFSIPEFYSKEGICWSLMMKTIPGGVNGDLFCNSGINFSFACFTGDFQGQGGYPISNSSQVMINNAKSWRPQEIITFLPDVHWEKGANLHQGFLTSAGVELFKKILPLKGAVYSVRKPNGTGHIGMILGAELQAVNIPGKGQKYRGWFYTIEFNTKNGTDFNTANKIQGQSDFYIQNLKSPPVSFADEFKKKTIRNFKPSEAQGDERRGGKLALRLRLIGALWFIDDKTKQPLEVTNIIVGSTEKFKGGAWSNGLGYPYKYRWIGDWTQNKLIFEP